MNALNHGTEIPAPWQESSPTRGPGKRWVALTVLAIMLLAGAGLWHLRGGPPAVAYDTAPVMRGDLENAVTASGRMPMSMSARRSRGSCAGCMSRPATGSRRGSS